MPWRKWLVRGFVYTVLGGGVVAFLLYHFWTSPATIRRHVLAKLAERFPGATVTLDSAHLRLFGGIAVGELRMARRDDLDKADFLYVPSAVLYHDKEQLLDGVLTLRKIEIFQPRLRIIRDRDGRLNLTGLMAPAEASREPLATLVVQQGTILVEDRSSTTGTPLLEIKDVNLTAVNDPLPVLSVEGGGRVDVLGPVRIRGTVRRDTGAANLDIELTAIPFGPALVQRLANIRPETAAHLRGFRADGEIRANLAYRPDAQPAFTFNVGVKLHKGELSHARLPLPLEDLEAELRLVNAPAPSSANPGPPELLRVASAQVKGRSGGMSGELSLEDVTVPVAITDADPSTFTLDNLVREMNWKIEHLPVTKDLLDQFPSLEDIKNDYKPEGSATVTHEFRRDSKGAWRKKWLVEPEGMSAEYINFRYRVDEIRGKLVYEKRSDGSQDCELDLTCASAGKPITVKGKTHGDGMGPSAVELTIRGDNIPLDKKLGQALQGPSRKAFEQFHPEGLGDFHVTIYRALGATRFANRFVIKVHDAVFLYDLFPYRLDDVAGVLEVLPDHWEARDFHGRHGSGVMRFSGRSFPPKPDGRYAPQMRINIQGTSIPLDKQFENALAPPGMPDRLALQNAWETMALSGQMSFNAEVIDLDGGEPANLDVKVTARGCSMRPLFFKYDLSNVGGTVHYTSERVTFENIEARHNAAMLSIRTGQILAKPNGGFQTRIGIPEKPGTGLIVTGMAADGDLLRALPERLRNGLEAIQLRGPFDVTTEMVIDPQDDGQNLIWWDGTMVVNNAAFQAGVDVTGVQGQASCCGLYKDQKLQSAVGNIWLTEASVVGQPFHQLHTRFVVDKDSPELLRFYDVGAELFGGQIGGQGNIDFTSTPQFELNLIGLQMKLEQFGRFNRLGGGAEVQGMAEVSLYLKGKVGDSSTLHGNGRLDVPNGKLYRLPPLLDLLKTLGLRAPDRTAFERARLEFNIEGKQVNITALNLFGSAVSLRGQGSVQIDGSDLFLDFNADPGMLQVPILTDVQQAVGDQLLKIKVRGKLTEPRFEKELMPIVVDPIRRLLGSPR